jgi:hypothetical protein
MFNLTLKRALATVAVMAGLLAVAGPAGAVVLYSGHAGLGASVYQHNQTDLEFLVAPQGHVTDGTSNTLQIGLVAPR